MRSLANSPPSGPPPVLVTGFGRFGANAENISASVALEFSKAAWVQSWILAVDQRGSEAAASAIRGCLAAPWSAVVHFGLAERAQSIRLERLAVNALDMTIPDNAGRQVTGEAVEPGAPAQRESTVSREIMESVAAPSYVELSEDAGRYICNETYFRTLGAATNRNPATPIPVVFVHLPSAKQVALSTQLEFAARFVQRMRELGEERWRQVHRDALGAN